MFHSRRWVVSTVATPEELAQKLVEMTWCGCAAFRVERTEYLFLNDATSADGAQEYAVVKGLPEGPPWLQLESLTFSWCTAEQALGFIHKTLAGEYDHAEYATPVTPYLDTPEQHGCCRLCR